MKIFRGTNSGVDYYDNLVTVGSIALSIEHSALPDWPRDGRLDSATLSRDEKGKLKLVTGKALFSQDGVEFSQQAALVIVDTHLIAREDFVLTAKSGRCLAPFSQSMVYMASAIQSPAACIYTRFHGILVMEPGAVFELKESYMRFALLDWLDRRRGLIKGQTRFTLRQQISYDGRAVQIEKLPLLREEVAIASTN